MRTACLLFLAAVAATTPGCGDALPEVQLSVPLPDGLETVRDGRLRKAVAAARERVTATPASAQAWAQLGHVFTAHDWGAEGVICYREARELEPDEGRWSYYVGRALLGTDPEGAVEAFGRFLETTPDYLPAHLFRARALRQLSRDEESRAHFQRVLSLRPRTAQAELGLGQLETSTGNHEAARKHLERALELDPRQSDAHKELAKVCMVLGDPEAAAHHARAGTMPRPVDALQDPLWGEVQAAGVTADWHAVRGAVHLNNGDFLRAVGEFEQAASDDPKDARFWLNFGAGLIQLKRYAQAIEALERSLSVAPAHESKKLTIEQRVDVLVNLGIALAKSGRTEDAQRKLEQALELLPRSIAAANNLAILLVQQGNRSDALDLLERVLDRDPNPATERIMRAVRARPAGESR